MGKWLICAAWPYINAVPHLGTLIGSVLSADVVARFLRLKGEDVVFVSGSDEHGTPIEVEAIKQNISPKELTDKYHELVKKLFNQWNISFDNYTRTENPIHIDFVRKFYLNLYKRGYIYEQEIEMPYCPKCNMFLPDRFIEGECPYCHYEKARGDQCDKCGRLLEPIKLINPRCNICGERPVIKKTKHWFFDLPKLTDKIRDYIEKNTNLPPNARNMSLSMLKEGLKPRAITRDNKWGIPAPFPGAEGKTIYVWMEAVLGYITATIEYFTKKGEPEKWKEFWFDSNTKSVYFIGKDNIPFHTIIFPALLIASGKNYVLPWTVSSTEYLLFKGEKFSKSRRIGIWIDEALKLFPVDYWRFSLLINRPENKDFNFTWEIFRDNINSLLNDTIGNFVHRTLTFIYKNFDAKIPQPKELSDEDIKTIEEAKALVKKVESLLSEFKIRDALMTAISLASLGNRYLNDKAPWELIKKDKEKAAAVMYVAAYIVKALAIVLYPFIPSSAQKIWNLLGFKGNISSWDEAYVLLPKAQQIMKPEPLFKKVSSKDLDEALKKLEELRSTA
ncbi:MAG: methionine--tRNA ligase [Thermoprotei archaeon]|nr:MAG: methionine--tRNA ligase [Thermoprotei archaeon]